MANFDDFPDELIVAIFKLLDSEDIVDVVQLVSRRFYHLCQEPKLWLDRCRSDYEFWSMPFRKRLAQAGRTNSGPWKEVWMNRRRGDAMTQWYLDRVLESKVKRMWYLEAICRRGLNAKDVLLDQMDLEDDATDDVLARRYYASVALASINRGLAVEEWCKVRADCQGFQSLDRALGAFDMFVLHDGDMDVDRIEEELDDLANQFRQTVTHPSLEEMTVRQKALALVRWIRARRLAGMDNADECYRDIRNCLIGQALEDPDHPSLPIISSAIFVSIGERIGLRAFCCAAPGHVFVTVLGNPGETVDGKPLDPETRRSPRPEPPIIRRPTFQERLMESEGDEHDILLEDDSTWQTPPLSSQPGSPIAVAPEPELPFGLLQTPVQQPQPPPRSSLPDDGRRMYLDPYSHDCEVTMQRLRESIAGVSWTSDDTHELLLLPTPTASIVLRTVVNLDASFATANELVDEPILVEELLWLSRGSQDMNKESLKYAMLWASLLLQPLNSVSWHRQLEKLMQRIGNTFSEDVWIIQRYLVPLYERHMAIINGTNQALQAPGGRGGNRHNFAGANGFNRTPAPEMDLDEDEDLEWARRLQQQRYQLSLADPTVMGVMVHNLDQRRPVVSRRYTQEIHDNVHYFVGQVFRHRRFHFVAIINGWSLDDPASLHFPDAVLPRPRNEGAEGEDGDDSDESDESDGSEDSDPVSDTDTEAATVAAASSRSRKSVFYTCLRSGAEKQVVAQHNIEILTDPLKIPDSLMFLAGKNFKRFDWETCTFVSNLREFYPDD
ncbi:hypothetical protein SEPCBS119000_002003 [Sporothrix epigloea]|uniref:F-box domain-containing protein n=1 Tax=Sporothrix epigloea TaxID=1892477 RepID=A0ABP0DH21_9PEZI